MAKDKAANVITIILAALMSVMLVVLAVATPVYMSLSALVKPDKMVQIVNKVGQALIESEKQGTKPEFSFLAEDVICYEPDQVGSDASTSAGGDADVAKMVEEYMEKLKSVVSGEAIINTVLAEFDLPETAVADLMDSKPAQEILMTYAEDVSNFFMTGEAEHSLTEEEVKNVLHEHIDEIVEIAKQSHALDLTDEEIKAKITHAIDSNAKEISEAVPPIQQVSSVVSEDVQTTIRVFTNPTIAAILIAICVLLAALIFVCRLRKFGGFLWLGIDISVAAVLLSIIYALLSKTHGLIENTALNILVGATVSVYMETVMLGMIILFAAALVFLALFFILKFTVVKKRELAAQ